MSTRTDELGRSEADGRGRRDADGLDRRDADERGRRDADERSHSQTKGSGRTSAAEREAAQLAQVVTRRAIKRLDMLEWVILFAGVGLAMLGGAVVAWIFAGMAGWDFRTTWIGASIALFVVPGGIAVIKIRREEREAALRQAETRNEEEEEDDG